MFRVMEKFFSLQKFLDISSFMQLVCITVKDKVEQSPFPCLKKDISPLEVDQLLLRASYLGMVEMFKIAIHPQLIVEVQKMNREKEFADFLLMKIHFRNGCFYRYTQSSLAKIMGWSRCKVRRLVALFLKLKWCAVHHSNLCFRNLNKIYGHSRKQVHLKIKEKTKESIFAQLYYYLLNTKQNHIRKAIAVKQDLIQPDNLTIYKSALKLERRFRRSLSKSEIDKHIRTSILCLGKFFNRSSATACRRIKLLKHHGLVSNARDVERLCRANVEMGHAYKQYKGLGSVFIKDGWLWRRRSNEYKLADQ